MKSFAFFLVLVVLSFCAVPAEALSGFVTEAEFRSFDPFAVDVYVQFGQYIPEPALLGTTGYYLYNPFYLFQGSFPINVGYLGAFFSESQIYFELIYGVSFPFGDFLTTTPRSLVGVDFLPNISALGFWLFDAQDHIGTGSGEYVTRARRDSLSSLAKYDFNFKAINDVFIGYINDVTGFQGLWAGWYRNTNSIDGRSVDDFGTYNSFSHLLAPSTYVGAGGDPHMVSRSTSSDLGNLVAGDVVTLVDNEHLLVNGAVREFSFLPASMRENNYFGSIGAQLASGERVLVQAFEDEAGAPAYAVTLDGQAVAPGTRLEAEAFTVHYDAYERLDGAHGQSWFQEQFPFQEHRAVVRVWVHGEVVVDVSLSSKEHFVDWHNAVPQVYEQAGAFLNVNMRDLRHDAHTRGLLRAVDAVHKRKHMRQRAIDAGQELEARDVDVNFAAVVDRIVDDHRVASLF